MQPVVIDIENLSKRYKLGSEFQLDQTLPEMIGDQAKRLMGRLRGKTRQPVTKKTDRDFHALKNINFQVRRGEVVGIIGHNGAGKSTLLKILSEITDPSEGQARIRGRVASLLEVGTGFHPELTGRENIYLNGSILGMTRKEITAKFDDIVAYSGIEQFIDTPVKRYSSGMSVRLAFSVAAHLDPEIMIVDEVLAVGDAEFQHRCLGRMQEVADSGRTVLFVSHNMAAVQTLCSRAILLQNGEVTADGLPDEIIPLYLNAKGRHDTDISDRKDRTGSAEATLTRCAITATDGQDVQVGKSWQIAVDYQTTHPDQKHEIGFCINTGNNPRVSFLSTNMLSNEPTHWPKAATVTLTHDEPCRLWPGTYSIDIAIHYQGRICDYVKDAVRFDVVLGNQETFKSMGRRPATVLFPASVSIQPTNQNSQTEKIESIKMGQAA